MKFGIFLSDADARDGNVLTAVEASVGFERDGFYSVSVNDHFYSPLGNPQSNQLECFTTLTAIAGATSKIKLVPAVAAASFRSPPLLAKIISALDQTSNGRFISGLGAGWQDKEYLAHGYEFPSLKVRLEQLDETIQIVKLMCSEKNPTFKGKHFEVYDAYNNPRPVQEKIPLMLGGSGTGLLRIAAREADILNIIPPTGNGRDFINDKPATLRFSMEVLKQRINLLHQFLDEEGRSASSVELGGLALVGLSHKENDKELVAIANHLGFPSLSDAQGSPVALLGTAAQVVDEIQKRKEETGITYYIIVMATKSTREIFVEEVMTKCT
ncbi:MAG: LLM class flavin-dependent oxidoreductase [Pseudomonadota bacterium]|nr:LLM class flavin-dependent oxidoreductase [Pseudomonadota bacterium]